MRGFLSFATKRPQTNTLTIHVVKDRSVETTIESIFGEFAHVWWNRPLIAIKK